MTHAEIATHCLEPVREQKLGTAYRVSMDAAINAAENRVAKALSDQRRDQLQAQADMLNDATPRGAKQA